MQGTRQLTLDVLPHPHVRHREDAGERIEGSLKIGGSFVIRRDLNAGDELHVRVTDADGQVVSTAKLEVGAVGLVPIKASGIGIIGTERVHKSKIVEDLD